VATAGRERRSRHCEPRRKPLEPMKKQKILLINDMAGYGKVATAAMLPVMSYFGYPTFNLPTALVSNTLDYGKFNILDTTEYIRGVFPVWKTLGFGFDAICTGFITSEPQARIISDYCKEESARGTVIFTDPIMGDEGKLYNGVTAGRIACMREIIAVADLIYPNYTEACYLTGTPYQEGGVSREALRRLTDKLRAIGTKSVLITSVKVDGQTSVAGYNHKSGNYFVLPYEEIPVHFPGTGDIFSAILTCHILRGEPLEQSARTAMDNLYTLIDLNRNNPDKNQGIPIEQCLSVLGGQTEKPSRRA
jgi:pyridoxine kinase